MADSLKQKTVSGALWSGIHKFSITLLGFISGIVLARLLTPHDYGVIGMLTIFLAVSQTFIDGGFGSALIQKKTPSDEDYSTILFWNLGLSVFLYFVLFFSAPFIARFYELPLLVDVLRVQSIVLVINAARIVQHNQLRKKLQFKKVALINVTSSIISLCVTIYLAYIGWGVWALVVQQLVLGLSCTVLYWITSKWRPLLTFSITSFKELFGFGGFILLSNLFNTFCNNIQGLLIGKVYNSATLGYYSKAMRTESYASTFFSSVLDQVSYPVLSETQNDKDRLGRILRIFIGTSAFITFPLMFLLILVAKPLFLLLYSERWLDSVPYFQLLCIAGIAISLQNINYYAVAALGKSKQLFKWTFLKRILGLLFILVGIYFFGIFGMIAGSVLASWTIYLINANLASKYAGYSLKRQLVDLLPVAVLCLTAFIVAFIIGYWIDVNIYLLSLVQSSIFVVIYIFFSWVFNFESLDSTKYILSIIKKKLNVYKL